jgi:hypothetical protein
MESEADGGWRADARAGRNVDERDDGEIVETGQSNLVGTPGTRTHSPPLEHIQGPFETYGTAEVPPNVVVTIAYDNEAGGYGFVPTAHPAVEPNDDDEYDVRLVKKAAELGLTPQRLRSSTRSARGTRRGGTRRRWRRKGQRVPGRGLTEVRTPLPPISNTNRTCTRATGWRRSPPTTPRHSTTAHGSTPRPHRSITSRCHSSTGCHPRAGGYPTANDPEHDDEADVRGYVHAGHYAVERQVDEAMPFEHGQPTLWHEMCTADEVWAASYEGGPYEGEYEGTTHLPPPPPTSWDPPRPPTPSQTPARPYLYQPQLAFPLYYRDRERTQHRRYERRPRDAGRPYRDRYRPPRRTFDDRYDRRRPSPPPNRVDRAPYGPTPHHLISVPEPTDIPIPHPPRHRTPNVSTRGTTIDPDRHPPGAGVTAHLTSNVHVEALRTRRIGERLAPTDLPRSSPLRHLLQIPSPIPESTSRPPKPLPPPTRSPTSPHSFNRSRRPCKVLWPSQKSSYDGSMPHVELRTRLNGVGPRCTRSCTETPPAFPRWRGVPVTGCHVVSHLTILDRSMYILFIRHI